MRPVNGQKTPKEWLSTPDFKKYKIVDPTGWTTPIQRYDRKIHDTVKQESFEPRDFTDKIDLSEFITRLMFSETTVSEERR